MMKKEERSARISELSTALRNEQLASIRDDLADLGHPNAGSITVRYRLNEHHLPILTRIKADGVTVNDFEGSDACDLLNGLLLLEYLPELGNSELTFSFQDLPPDAE